MKPTGVICLWVTAVFGRSFSWQSVKAVMSITPSLRSSEADELAGLGSTEMGVLAYPDFSGSTAVGAASLTEAPVGSGL